MPKQGITRASAYGEHFEARHITRTLSRRSPHSEAYNPRLPRYGVTMGYDRTKLLQRRHHHRRHAHIRRLHIGRFRLKSKSRHRKKMKTLGKQQQEALILAMQRKILSTAAATMATLVNMEPMWLQKRRGAGHVGDCIRRLCRRSQCGIHGRRAHSRRQCRKRGAWWGVIATILKLRGRSPGY